MKEKVIYYNINGRENKFMTYINNHAWVMPTVVLIMITVMGFIESL